MLLVLIYICIEIKPYEKCVYAVDSFHSLSKRLSKVCVFFGLCTRRFTRIHSALALAQYSPYSNMLKKICLRYDCSATGMHILHNIECNYASSFKNRGYLLEIPLH